MPGTYRSPAETGLYYLQSRYYDPEICRFVNADRYARTGQGFIGCNMFAYCLNNPVIFADFTGSLGELVIFPLLAALTPIVYTAAVTITAVAAVVTVAYLVYTAADYVNDVVNQAKKSSAKSSGNTRVDTGGGTASPPTPGSNKNSKDNNGNWEKVNERYLESQLRKQGTDPHSIKYEYLGSRAKVSRYDLYVDKVSGRLAIFEKSTGRLVEITNYFIK